MGLFAVNSAINAVGQTSLNFLDNSGIVTGGAADYSIAGTSTMSVNSNSGQWAAAGIEIVQASAAAATHNQGVRLVGPGTASLLQ